MSNQATILTVDDDPVMLASVADILRISGYAPVTATNGMNALQVMQSQVPDLIVADIMMPEMDGYQFCKTVRENPVWRAIPFIFLTARGEQDDIHRGYGLGADHYLTKPFEPEDLLLVVKSKLQRLVEIRETTREEVEITKSKLLSAFGNELSAPLSFIYDYINLLQEGRRSLGDETTAEILAQMRKGVDEMVSLVEDLMTIVYIDSGAMGVEIERSHQHVDLGFVAQYAVRESSLEADKRGVAVSLLAPNDLSVLGIAAYVQDIVKRIIDYAIKSAQPVDGRVQIRIERQDEYAVASIHNNGIGVDPDCLAHLFVPFKEINEQAIAAGTISNLGLVIAERLVRLHGGSIRVDNGPDEGTTFTVILPAIPAVE